MSQIHEECGVFGIFAKEKTDVAHSVYYGLYALQHRGQESCGIVVNDDGIFASYRDSGLVNDVFTKERLSKLGEGNMAVGHVRYGTAGTKSRENAQPLLVNHTKGRMAIAHNGNIVNSYDLRTELELEGSIFQTSSDAEVIAYNIIKERIKNQIILLPVTASGEIDYEFIESFIQKLEDAKLDEYKKYDGIWACSSILHLSKE